MRKIRLLAAALSLGLAAYSQPVGAQVTFYNVCSPGTFKICASAQVAMQGSNVIMKVWNMNQYGLTGATPNMSAYSSTFGGWSTITAVGLSGMGYTLAAGGSSVTAAFVNGSTRTTLTKWGTDATANAIQVYNTGADADNGHKEGIVGCSDPGPNSAGHVKTCGSYPSNPYVEFTFSGLNNVNFTNATFKFHGQQVASSTCNPTNYSAGCLFANSLKGEGLGNGPPPPPVIVTPEPVSTLLLGSGLLGLAAARRRRRSSQPETPAS